jgi:uncharacterized protein YggU (UPF0235/DUF167 family)
MNVGYRGDETCVEVAVRVRPKSPHGRVLGERAGSLLVAVASPPEKGKANEELAEVIADELSIPKSAVEVVFGHACRDKRVRIAVSRTRFAAWLAVFLKPEDKEKTE